ncbi:cupin domain-containing protein [Adhaeribacter radiodurans]|uniref:Cupin domain-containing protein n=1 Tax=Adhaeribacter radiodurans TaxID=2745197 RepID=A0A7L7L713_9BACT|nr:cupin domain-containing protein [Adhaeribacter radiodurans]QMU28139.1 cupin domain-containing protein [Adhaeribacter radiodurans]
MKEQITKQQPYQELLVLTNLVKLIVPQENTGGQYAIFEDNVPPLGGPPPHTHPDEEVFYILSGEFEFVLNDLTNPIRAVAGSVVHIPSYALHTFKNIGKTTGKMITIVTPGNLENYFREVGQSLGKGSVRPDLSVPPDFAKLDPTKFFELAPKYDISFYLPEVVG